MNVSLSFSSLLGLLFIALKLCDKIDWSWIWVLSPFWIPLAATLGVFLLALIVLLLIAVFEAVFK